MESVTETDIYKLVGELLDIFFQPGTECFGPVPCGTKGSYTRQQVFDILTRAIREWFARRHDR